MTLPPDLRRDLRTLAATPRLLVCCDYDGTLAPIVADPAKAVPLPGAARVLERLAALPATTVALLSGRARAVLSALAGPPAGVLLVGAHGLELDDEVTALTPAESQLIQRLHDDLAPVVGGVDGVLLEPKPTGVAVHVRRCERVAGDAVLDAVTAGPGVWPGVHVLHGKRVVELSVRPLGKGAAVDALRQRVAATGVLVVGDDVTDEDAFAAVSGGAGTSVKVGTGTTSADHRVPGPPDVLALLDLLLRSRRSGPVYSGSGELGDG